MKTQPKSRKEIPAAPPPEPGPTMTEIANSAIDERVSRYRERLKYFLLGLGFFLVAVTAADLISNKEIIREIHKLAFPVDMPEQSPAFYSSTIVLKASDQKNNFGMMAFYAEPQQDVRASVYVGYRFGNDKPLPVLITVDSSIAGAVVAKYDDTITHYLSFKQPKNKQGTWNGEPDIHHIGFSLSTLPTADEENLEITITYIVQVFKKK